MSRRRHGEHEIVNTRRSVADVPALLLSIGTMCVVKWCYDGVGMQGWS
jgi:hypothetical protein